MNDINENNDLKDILKNETDTNVYEIKKRKLEALLMSKKPTVMVYSTPTCPWCAKSKQWFKEHDIEFEDIDVSSDREKAMEMIKKSGQQGVPVVDINGKIIVGFNPAAFEAALEEAKKE